MELGTGWRDAGGRGDRPACGVGLSGSMHSARVFEQGVGNGPAREGGGPAQLVQPVPGPCQSHPCGLGTTPSSRPTGAKAPRRRRAPSPSWPGCPDAAGDCPALGLQTSIWRRTLCPSFPHTLGPRAWGGDRIRGKFTYPHPRVSLGLSALR